MSAHLSRDASCKQVYLRRIGFAAGVFEDVCDRLIALLPPHLSSKVAPSEAYSQNAHLLRLFLHPPRQTSVDRPFQIHGFHDQRLSSQRGTLIIPPPIRESPDLQGRLRFSLTLLILPGTTPRDGPMVVRNPSAAHRQSWTERRTKPEGYHGPESSSSPQLNLPCFERIGVLNAGVWLVSR